MDCKIKNRFMHIFGFQVMYLVLDWSDLYNRIAYKICSQKKKAVAILPWRSHLFSSLILTLL
ncbi:hypothetical protein [uncultured Coprobacter sp.]|uniref:hypothetical protein n=1 Tax=uncultured Coprobacter sp. TaxID=1720550 RepID=UPI00261D8A55|nr:hypothetical protein [uncultured Coprobacter sp.]